MRVRALRGVCIGPSRHLKPGEEADLDAGLVQFLSSIKAVERIPEEEPKAAPAAKVESIDAPAKTAEPKSKEK